MRETSIYQHLRSHLAYLRLTAISEVLTAELERAQQEQLSATALLERLFALEVTATETRRYTSRLRFASFPAAWTLEAFDFDAQPKLDRKLVEELATLRFLD